MKYIVMKIKIETETMNGKLQFFPLFKDDTNITSMATVSFLIALSFPPD